MAKSKPKSATSLPEVDYDAAADCLRALAHPARLKMVQMLLVGQYPVAELAEGCGIADNVASEHLRLLQRCGFLTSRREGRKVFYEVAEPHLGEMMRCIQGRFGSDA